MVSTAAPADARAAAQLCLKARESPASQTPTGAPVAVRRIAEPEHAYVRATVCMPRR